MRGFKRLFKANRMKKSIMIFFLACLSGCMETINIFFIGVLKIRETKNYREELLDYMNKQRIYARRVFIY